ncbi:hypothetical protein lerEdw1_002240, partial [Lerista edwardsae]
SENGGGITKDMIHKAELPVKYAMYIISTATEASTKYVNFTAGEEEASKPVEHRFEVKNLRERSVPVSVRFQIPVKLKGTQVWNVTQVVPSKPQLAKCVLENETLGARNFQKLEHPPCVLAAEYSALLQRIFMPNSVCVLWSDPRVSFYLPQDCSVASCKVIRCDILSLRMRLPLEFEIKGDVRFQWSQIQPKKVTLVSSAQIIYNETKYTQKEGFVQSQVQTVVEHIEVYNYLPVIIGSTIGGLVLLALIAAGLYKVGFFKRQYKQMLKDAGSDDGAPPQDQASLPPSNDNVY